MERKEPQTLTATELNAAVYRYLQESGFVHTAFNFFNEADIGKGNIQGMIPPGTLIRIVQRGLQHIELEANSENGSDDEYQTFDTLDLMTNDLDQLKEKIISSVKHNAVENDKEQKTGSVETDKGQKINSVETTQKTDSTETTTMDRKQRMEKTKAVQKSNSDKAATICRGQPMRQAKAHGLDSKEQNINSAETAQKADSAEATTGQRWQVSWIGKKLRIKRRKQ